MAQYICEDKCFHNGKLYRRGDIATFADGETPVTSKKTDKTGRVIDEGGKLAHFKLLEGPKPAEPEKAERSTVKVNGRDKATQ